MKKLILFSFLFLYYLSSTIAQVKEAKLNPGQKSIVRKALKIEVYTQDGNRHSGFLFYADFDKLYLTKNPLKNDSILAIQIKDIYQIKAISHLPFMKRFVNGMVFSAGVMTFFTMEMYRHGDAIMIGPSLIFGAGTTIFGTPFSVLAALVFPQKQYDFEYRIDGQQDVFNKSASFLKMKQISTVNPQGENVRELLVRHNTEKLKNISKPIRALHPDATKSIHFMFSASTSLFDLGKQVDKVFADAPNFMGSHYNSYFMGFNGKLQVNVSSKLRPFLSYSYGESGYGNGMHLPQQEQVEFIYINYDISYGSIGLDYVLNPRTNISILPFEFSVGAGLSYAKLSHEYYSNNYEFFSQAVGKTYTSYGLQINTRLDYYFSRSLSINFALSSEIMSPIHMDDIFFESRSFGSTFLDGGVFNTSNMHALFGLGIHL